MAFRSFKSGDKSDMVQQTVIAVKAEQKRTDYSLAGRVTKSANYAIGCADLFYFHRRGAFTRSVRGIEAFCDDAIQVAACFCEPTGRNAVISRGRGEPHLL